MSHEEPNPYSPPAADPQGPYAAPPSVVAGVSPGVLEALGGTKPWTLLLAILGFVGAGFMVLGALGAIVAAAAFAAR